MALRGRPKGSKNKVKTPPSPGDGNGIGHNSQVLELTDEERQALAHQHMEQYERALALKKKTDADFKNTCKSARAALGPDAVDLIKDMILIETDEGREKLRERARRAQMAARYMAAEVGMQFDFFAEPPPEGAESFGDEATA